MPISWMVQTIISQQLLRNSITNCSRKKIITYYNSLLTRFGQKDCLDCVQREGETHKSKLGRTHTYIITKPKDLLIFGEYFNI